MFMQREIGQGRTASLKLCVLPGDGIGTEVTELALPVFDALNIGCVFDLGDIGWECWKAGGDPVPPETWQKIADNDVTLLGAVTSKPLREAEAALPPHLQGKGHPFVSPVVQLRQKLGLFANIRPVTDVLGNDRFRFTVIRENTEGLYAGLDFGEIPEAFEPLLKTRESRGAPWSRNGAGDASMAVRLQTRAGLFRLFRFAFDYARRQGFEKVTWADKPNVLRHSGAFARECLEAVAAEYPDIDWAIENIDAIALWMVRRPERFGVIVAENMFGDILSDLGAGVMGGLGFAPSANIGEAGAYFEPVHGSAPQYVGQGKVNPSAMFLTIALLLEHLGRRAEATAIENAVSQVARSECRTYDLGGKATTDEVAAAILERVRALHPAVAQPDSARKIMERTA
ncbi:isocitrate/isopropylmalate dehydrogenase family protein [Ciceribacter sp. RN22]|uniref:isocitrate/isopropylmalate dehydrogenase family protein n=1 Tax=Ciceribacter sp. RN22 TaxID=2954932 RepID=UPI0020936642|nr:isocitrate/isopropylmalate family dehydrogenase [Ciceribacter sp. RN22]MCO6179432.1 isocitrate/isopropylmalate family dehydrogenase [Ciceribacter sp. RN22]